MQFTRSPVAVPEGDAPTRARVVQTILQNGPSTAADLARLLDLTPAAVEGPFWRMVCTTRARVGASPSGTATGDLVNCTTPL